MSLHRLHQARQDSFKPIPTNTVTSFPEDDKRVPDGLIVDAPTVSLPRAWPTSFASQQSNSVLSVETRQDDKLVEDFGLLSLC
jgi:hypothetical protein